MHIWSKMDNQGRYGSYRGHNVVASFCCLNRGLYCKRNAKFPSRAHTNKATKLHLSWPHSWQLIRRMVTSYLILEVDPPAMGGWHITNPKTPARAQDKSLGPDGSESVTPTLTQNRLKIQWQPSTGWETSMHICVWKDAQVAAQKLLSESDNIPVSKYFGDNKTTMHHSNSTE